MKTKKIVLVSFSIILIISKFKKVDMSIFYLAFL